MADGVKVSLDFADVLTNLDTLAGPVKESLMRRMAVSGGVEIRDEAKRWVPVEDGTLRDAIYLVFNKELSTKDVIVYSISWNATIAPHGHLQEFGHWMTWQTIFNVKLGRFQTLAKGKGPSAKGVLRTKGPKFIPPKTFLRPAYQIAVPKSYSIMIQRGEQELPLLIAEHMK